MHFHDIRPRYELLQLSHAQSDDFQDAYFHLKCLSYLFIFFSFLLLILGSPGFSIP